MKKTLLASIFISAFLLSSCDKQDTIESSSEISKSKQTTSTLSIAAPATIGVEKGQRKNCPPSGNTKICCGRKFCVVTPLSSYDESEPVLAPNYFEGIIDAYDNETLVITIPFNKILPATYNNWFINNVYEAEYFPLDETIANNIGLSNIAISEGNYDVIIEEGIGYKIFVNFQQQIVEIQE